MTKTTEELKREMYHELEHLKSTTAGTAYTIAAAGVEESLEAYLEALRQEVIDWAASNKKFMARNEYLISELKSSEEQVISANNLVIAYREECDSLRNKLQAFEFANRSAAELLSEALREPSGLRRSAGSMVHQSSGDHCTNVACACSNSSFWPSSETPKPIQMIIRAEFDDRIRTTCTACNRSEDVFK